jgi:hypothetical protein
MPPFETEPCPQCSGTGLRIVPPPPKRAGEPAGSGGRTHGYEATYIAGCRCVPCTAAHREAAVRRSAKKAAS